MKEGCVETEIYYRKGRYLIHCWALLLCVLDRVQSCLRIH
jgi:hypothetical protein